ncbi:hypothetical protein PMIT1320_00038 [Prochlorococcus marinus str. MIT 1320]|nr:hypothetical protein PMIT1320_00038 [Prochlorococcus marinus str. MIT 1320]
MVFDVFHAGVDISCMNLNWYAGFQAHADVSMAKALAAEVRSCLNGC